MELIEIDRHNFEANPARYIENAIKSFIANSPSNRLEAFGNTPIFDEPLVGFADGDDPIFLEYKQIIGDFHLTPREALDRHRQTSGKTPGQPYAHVSAIAWVLPIAYETRLSLRKETRVPSLRWNHTRWHGEDLIIELSRYLITILEKLEYDAVAPMNTDFFKMSNLPSGAASNWSHRHIAYACGLGTFSLSDGFISPRGIAHRCGSIVAGLALTPTPRPYAGHLANCLFYHNHSCRRCMERCPAGAITEAGHDKRKCQKFLHEQIDLLRKLSRDEGYIGRYAGCGLCQTKVPCEDRIPPDIIVPVVKKR